MRGEDRERPAESMARGPYRGGDDTVAAPMRALPVSALMALTALHCTRAPSAGGPPIATPPIARARPALSPEADPEAFRVAASTLDVDGDGRDDRVLDLPDLGVGDRRGLLREAPPTVVAHRLADGRFALDDEVTRALLRAACPESPRATYVSPGDTPEATIENTLIELFWTGFCVRAWGGTPDEAERAIRATTLPAGLPDLVAEAARAAREAVLPITLTDRPVEPLSGRPATAATASFTPPPPPRPVDPRCAAVIARNRQHVAAANRLADAQRRAEGPTHGGVLLDVDAQHRPCEATPAGVWSLTLATARYLIEVVPHVTADTTLTWTPTTGAAVSLATPLVAEQLPTSSTYPTLEGVYDWDGDGVHEVVLRVERRVEEAAEPDTVTVYTVRDGVVRPYAPAQSDEAIVSVEDVDRDGRPDLILASPWRTFEPCGHVGTWRHGPTLAAHALPDGTFSTRDEVARAWVMRQCERGWRGEHSDVVGVFDVACARAWGQSPEAVVAASRPLVLALRRSDPVRAAGAEACTSFHELAAIAALALPFEALDAGLTPLPDTAVATSP